MRVLSTDATFGREESDVCVVMHFDGSLPNVEWRRPSDGGIAMVVSEHQVCKEGPEAL